jgi:hypothetical protein
MILHVHTDGSHLVSRQHSTSGAVGGYHHFLGNNKEDDDLLGINGAALLHARNHCQGIPVVTASAAETELAAAFINARQAT